jgi:hypothetical protein
MDAALWYKGRYLAGSGILTRGRGELIPLFFGTTVLSDYSTVPQPHNAQLYGIPSDHYEGERGMEILLPQPIP